MLDTLPKLNDSMADPKSEKSMQPDYCKNETRSIKPEILVAVGICTHLGCSPSAKFKMARDGICGPTGWAASSAHVTVPPSTWPAESSRTSRHRTNLVVPPHKYLSEKRILIGEDKKGA